MRTILNISMTEEMGKYVRREVKEGNFSSLSEFMRHLIRLYNTEKLAQEIEESRKELLAGRGVPKTGTWKEMVKKYA